MTTATERIEFKNPEYQADGSFEEHQFVYEGNAQEGWQIERDGNPYKKLGPGYTLVKTRYCGVCSTDLARKFLPYELPQIIGHEVVGETNTSTTAASEENGGQGQQPQLVVIEINASEYARGVHNDGNPYDDPSMHTQDPKRITLGINELPGGFAPVVLAPIKAVIPVPTSITAQTAALTEPFAAALQGVEATLPQSGDKVAVLGPRRLGALLLAALAGVRQTRPQLDFDITAIVRHDRLHQLATSLGADHIVDTRKIEDAASLKQQYDIVFDTTGKPEGFRQALELSRRVVHLKSTNGQKVEGLQYLTDLVVDEMALVPYNNNNNNNPQKALDFTWPNEETTRKNLNIYAAPGVSANRVEELKSKYGRQVTQAPIQEVYSKIVAAANDDNCQAPEFLKGSPFPRFDLAIASSLVEVDAILRPEPGKEIGLVRARGAILIDSSSKADETEEESTSALWRAIVDRGISLHSSRCGNFKNALDILDKNPDIAKAMESELITHQIPLEEIESAFDLAADSSKSVKVLVATNDR